MTPAGNHPDPLLADQLCVEDWNSRRSRRGQSFYLRRVDRLLRQGAHRRHRLHVGEPFAGGLLKLYLVAHALDRGVITPSTILDDIERGPGGIGNADDAFLGPMLTRSALANSRNVPAAQLVARLGVDETYGYPRELKRRGRRL
ncbi:MAG: penicillin-binding transpeptidase domain-containing protein [Thermoanaerobaculia bacterium]|nr:penicillin-binding transpeptidase domain-containing protein [Thermoanaerobaculia bacterium]